MSDDLKNRGPADRARINVNEEWEVAYWCKEVGVTPEELKGAVRSVGVMAADVRRYLGKIDGIYAVQFRSGSTSFGSGVAIISANSVYGGDANYYYKGTLNPADGSVTGSLSINHHSGPMNSIFGPIKQFGLSLNGTIKDGVIQLQGNVVGMPQQRITIHGNKVSDL